MIKCSASLSFYLFLACLTQNTRLIRLAIRVNCTYNRTNCGLIRVTLGPFECIRDSRVCFLKLLKKLTRVTCPWLIVLAIVQDRVRLYETVQDRVRPYMQPHMKSTPRVGSTVSISHINRMESNSNKSQWDRM